MTMPTCREVSRAVAADELENAGLRRRLVIRFHLLRCRHCRNYVGQLRAIGEAVRGMFGGEGEEERERLDRLEDEILGACLPGDDDRDDDPYDGTRAK